MEHFCCSTRFLVRLLWFTVLLLSQPQRWTAADAGDISSDDSDDSSSSRMRRQKSCIYTYFEHIPSTVRTTGMDDDDDQQLVDFWKASWSSAGWKPIILGFEDVQRLLGNYSTFETDLNQLRLDPWSRVIFHRWMAMAAIDGGWYVDYDVFPLPDFQQPPASLPNKGRMTVYDIHSPTLASGTGEQWLSTLQALLVDAKQNVSPIADRATFWTDSLGINNLVKNHGKQSPAPLTEKRVMIPYSRKDPVLSRNAEDCSARSIRNRWVIHMGPRVFQAAKHMSTVERHPRNRRTEAQKWLLHWNEICHKSIGLNDTAQI